MDQTNARLQQWRSGKTDFHEAVKFALEAGELYMALNEPAFVKKCLGVGRGVAFPAIKMLEDNIYFPGNTFLTQVKKKLEVEYQKLNKEEKKKQIQRQDGMCSEWQLDPMVNHLKWDAKKQKYLRPHVCGSWRGTPLKKPPPVYLACSELPKEVQRIKKCMDPKKKIKK